MYYATVISPVADVRSEPRFESERESQLIFGESVKITGYYNDYAGVICNDGVHGFIKKTQLGEYKVKRYKTGRHLMLKKIKMPFSAYIDDDDISNYNIPEDSIEPVNKKREPFEMAMDFLTVPYLWGGTSSFGFDCSGFTQRLFRYNNVEIPRNSEQQREFSAMVNGLDEARPNDLVFFKGHVGLYIGDMKIVHANGHYGGVTVTDLSDGSEYSRYLISIMLKIGRIKANVRV
ncbi:C40 family peptidase [Picrophilus oshimae]|uniref:Hypothetical membrane associated protein n=1 Tax=Picrophilus torridus (strain ATCC 700027 / DSM 9790 / JCM 10055 / NBRC 100828 / KAW 2/3) TaxID=1122961 RepID=Q6L349_PICTO|nr:C40 family peptidase [Picrophilus oshimae]AAT42602.1 hypothetical membrane associated protein [Picrophilus oshimae DSM 9789]